MATPFALLVGLLTGLTFGPQAAWGQACTTTSTLNYVTAGTGNRKTSTETVGGTSFTYGYASSVPGGQTNTFAVGTSAALSGQTLVWQVDNTNNSGTNTSSATLSFTRPVNNLTIQLQDIDSDTNFQDDLVFEAYLNGSNIATTLTSANFTTGANNTYVSGGEVQGTNPSAPGEASGNLTATMPAGVTSLVIRYNNIRAYTAGANRTQTLGINSITWCAQADIYAQFTTAPTNATAGQSLTYTVQFGNSGPDAAASGITRQVTLPAGAVATANGGGTYSASTNTITFPTLTTLASGASNSFTYTYTAPTTAGPYDNVATIGATTASSNPTANDSQTQSVLVTAASDPCATAPVSLTYANRAAGENWKTTPFQSFFGVPSPTSATQIRAAYTSTSADANSSLTTNQLNGVRTLLWSADYATRTANSSSVTYTFNRPVSNLSVRVQDIDAFYDAGDILTAAQAFTDEVTFTGSLVAGGTTTAVTPSLAKVNTASTFFTILNNVATGVVASGNNTSTTDATVIATFASPVTSITIQYRNTENTITDPSGQSIGIDQLTWCRLVPVANNVTNSAPVLTNLGQVGLNGLSSTVDGTVQNYTIASLPAATDGVLYYNNGGTYSPVAVGQSLTPAQAATLRFAPVAGTTSANATFTYNVRDDAGVTSTSPATFTIPLRAPTACVATATLDLSTRPANEDWKNHAALPVPAASTQTQVSTSGYASGATGNGSANTLTTAVLNANTPQTLLWDVDYAATNTTSSTVTLNFNRAVSNFTVQVQDIDATTGFTDQVTFVGNNSGTGATVIPVLSPMVPNAGFFTITGNTATGVVTANGSTSTTDATVTAYFADPITSLTITYANATATANPGEQAIGIDLLTFCRLLPVANNVTNTSRPSGQGATAINGLSATAPDGTIASYTITALPPASQGTFYANGVALTASTLTLTPAQAAQLTFAPAAGFSGNAGFSYFATDDGGAQSNTATYTVPVTNTGGSGTPAPCATPGKDGAPTGLAGVVNTYFAGTASVAAKTTTTSIPVAASVGASTGITPGDLLLVIQMQGADINSGNSNAYGANNASGGGNLNNTNFIAGTYEYVVATSSLAAGTAGSISVAALANSYSTAAATTTAPRQSYQVVRIPQYTSITLGGQLDALAWNGSAGGILAIDVAGTLNLNSKVLNAAAAGFRGGAGFRYTGAAGTANTDYRTSNSLNTSNPNGNGTGVNGTKGEGTAGTPRYTLLSLTAATRTDNAANAAAFASGVVDGYPSGDNGKGAPGNAGGGATDDSPGNNAINNGGGGGANGGAGGLGGWPRINGSAINTANQALGGVSFAPVSSSRLVMGGGGGAGTSNDGNGDTGRTGIYSSGAPGGGLILVRTGSVSGTGTANASGDGGYLLTGNLANSGNNNDGAGGGGAGGTVLITANTPAGLANLTVLATGGKGNSNSNSTDVAHGPGGGGGGGVILANGALNSASSAVGGVAGTIVSSDSYTGTSYGAVAGMPGVLNTQISTSIANSAAGTTCVANVATTITGPATASAGQPTGNYTATFSNANTSGAANVTQTVALPTGAGLTAAQQATIVAAYPGTTFTTTGSGTNTNTTINFGTTTLLSGGANSFVFAYTAPTTAGTVSTTSNTSTTTNEAGQTANNTASVSTTVATAADVTVSLTGPTTLNAGQPTGNFTATFTNEGIGTATSIARQVTLPTGASLTVAQQATIVAAYANATFTTTGSGTTAVTTIDFGTVASLVNDASSAVTFAFTAPTTPATNLTLTGNTGTMVSEGTNSAPNQTTLALTTVATADVTATIAGSTSLVNGVATGAFNVAFANNGPQAAAGVTRTVQLSTGLTGVVVSGNDAGTYSPTTGLVTYTTTPTSLNSGASLTSTITFPIPATGGQVAATASVNTTTNEAGLTTNNSATAVMPAAYDLTTTISGPTTAVAGSPVTLYVTTTNNGPNTAPSALQTVSIPSSAPLTNVYITNGGTYTYNSQTKIGTVTFPDPANLPSGVTVTNLPSGQTIANSISFAAPAETFAPTAMVALNNGGIGSGDLTPSNNTAYLNNGAAGTPVVVNTNTTALATANESTTLTTTSTIVSAGTNVTYKVAATNHGPGVATNVIEQVQLLPNLTPVALTVGGITGTLSGTTITYTSGTTTVATYSTTTGIVTYATLATQASGATQTYGDIVLTVPANAGNNGQLLATAAVRTSTNDPAPADNVSAVAVKVTSTADLASTVTGPSSVAAGQTANYTVAFTNNGTGTAGSVAETMQLPAGLGNTVVVQDPSGNVLAGAYNSTTGVVTFPTVASDAVGATQVYNVVFPAPGQSYSVSSSIGSGTLDNVGTNNASVLATTVTQAADVSVAVSGPATTTAGNAVTYAVTTINNGPDQANTVTPTIQLPMNLTGVVVVPSGGTYDASTGKVTFTAYRLAPGESRVSLVTFPMPTNPTNGFVTGMAAVTTASSDLVLSNNTAGITTSVAPATPDQADLVTSVTGPTGTVAAGSPLTYTIRVSNTTASTPAVNVVPTAYLPAGLTGVVVKDPSGNVLPNAYNSTTGQIIFPTIASLSSGTTPAYTVSLTAPAVTSPGANPTLITASAVSANTSDPNLANNAVGNSLAISASFDEVTSLSGPTKALPGSTNTYTVTTTNNGPSTAPTTAGTVQTVTLPAGVTATNISGNGTQSGNVITFPAISTTQATGANGAVVNTFSIVMPATGSLPLSAAVTSTGESNQANDGATLTTMPTNQVPVADNVWNTLQSARGNTANVMASKGLPISPLAATDPDGSVASFTITSVPDVSQGMLYYNGALVSAGQTVAASGLSFAPTSTFVGNATFTYVAVDNGNAVSNTALYTIPVAQDMLAVYTAYNSSKGGSNQYVTGDVLAQVIDANTATYNDGGLIYNATTGVLQAGAANGMSTTGTNATITSGTLPTGVSLDPATGRIYVSNAAQLVNNPSPQTYTVTITTVDSNGGVTTQPVSFTIGAYPLPVVLTAFTASAVQNRDALLNWATASEKNNDHFDVERSFDGTSFVQLAKVAGHGTTTTASAYSLTDAGVAAKATGPVYYRLRQVDLDGTATYSPVRSVSFTAATAPVALSLFPNPAQASTTLELSQLPATGTYQVTLLDATGRTVRTATLGGGLPRPLDISDLATGAYHVVVTGQLADGSALRQVLRLTKE